MRKSLILISLLLFAALLALVSTQSLAAQRGIPTPPGAALQALYYHHDTATPTRTLVPTKTSTPTATPTKRPTATPVLYCMIVEMYVQNGQPLVEWKFSNAPIGQGQVWFGIYPANIQPVCVHAVL